MTYARTRGTTPLGLARAEAPQPAAPRAAMAGEGLEVAEPLKNARFGLPFSPALAVMLTLIVIDLGFIFGHILHILLGWGDGLWLVSHEMGHPEAFQQKKLLILAVLCFLWTVWAGAPTLLAWTATFTLLWADDTFMLHESFGRIVADYVGEPPEATREEKIRFMGISSKNMGELGIAVIYGIAVFGLVVVAYRNGSERFRVLSRRLLLVLLALGFVGVVLDHFASLTFIHDQRFLRHTLAILEDGGEMIVASVGAGVVIAALPHVPVRRRRSRASGPEGPPAPGAPPAA